MADKELVKYIQQYHSQGYSLETLRGFLQQQGYKKEVIEAAIGAAYTPEHHGHKWYWILGALVALLVVLSSVFLLFNFFEDTPTLTLTTAPTQQSVEAGNPITLTFIIAGAQQATPATISYQITREGTLITQEQLAIDASKRTFTQSFTPQDPGRYTVTTNLAYAGESKQSSFSFTVTAEQEEPIPIEQPPEQNQTDEFTCGDGLCSEGEICAQDCPVCGNDLCEENEQCEADCAPVCGDNVCEANEVCELDCSVPVCGDGLCEVGESCSQDCQGAGSTQTTKFELAKTIPEKVESQGADATAKECNGLDQDLREYCFNELTKASGQAFYCKFITTSRVRDDCYITHAFNQGDYTVCSQMQDPYKKQTCESLELAAGAQQQLG